MMTTCSQFGYAANAFVIYVRWDIEEGKIWKNEYGNFADFAMILAYFKRSYKFIG
jgi:hypothetical protein